MFAVCHGEFASWHVRANQTLLNLLPTIDMFWDLVLRYAPFGMVCCHLVDAAHNRADLLATNTSTGDDTVISVSRRRMLRRRTRAHLRGGSCDGKRDSQPPDRHGVRQRTRVDPVHHLALVLFDLPVADGTSVTNSNAMSEIDVIDTSTGNIVRTIDDALVLTGRPGWPASRLPSRAGRPGFPR
jgi:hypothetical protein